ncbi:MAG: DNA-binding protein [Candidatus Acidulodesulfobacterium acidiphilum]|uniref:DNA-binding protein n=1 Tax=Candidatus Acidulodesulfobacterium acidiphilum TaxID=2597224 RepID=A0A520XGD4_9DELT|nr:MAG: DNA-binding protein [Candidatus Acidulodesulfobacterium acidiphilum]
MKEKLYTVKEVAEFFKVSPVTIYDWVYRKKLKSTKICGSIRFQENDILVLLKS